MNLRVCKFNGCETWSIFREEYKFQVFEDKMLRGNIWLKKMKWVGMEESAIMGSF